MLNLAEAETRDADRTCLFELEYAGIPAVISTLVQRGEVATYVSGLGHGRDGRVIACTRFWYYWCVRLSTGFDVVFAKALHDLCGDQVRADGFAGGHVPEGPVDTYHVDSTLGLRLLWRFLNDRIRIGGT